MVPILLTLPAGEMLLAQSPAATAPSVDFCAAPAPTVGPRDGGGPGAAAPPRPLGDWAGLCRYREANRAASAAPRPDILFFGDSITENWATHAPDFFRSGYLNRGIGGQTSAQMLLRFYQDVVALRPKAMHLVAGTNDVAGNVGAMGPEAHKNNIRAIVGLAQANRIRVIIGSIPPARSFYWRPAIAPAEPIRQLNAWLRNYAARCGATFIDYHAAMAAPDGGLRSDLSDDGVHPNAAGYRLMRRLAEPALRQALTQRPTKAGTSACL